MIDTPLQGYILGIATILLLNRLINIYIGYGIEAEKKAQLMQMVRVRKAFEIFIQSMDEYNAIIKNKIQETKR